MFSTAYRNLLLDTVYPDRLSLHSAYSATGANELSGGSPAYAKKTPTYAAAASGAKALSNTPAFDVPAGATVRWVGRWGSVGTVFYGMAPNGAAPIEFYVDTAADKIKAPAHGLANTTTIVFYGGTVPGGLVAGTIYYVVNAATDDFQVAATSGGSAIDLTSQAGNDCVVSKIIEEVYGAQGTFTVTSDSLDLNR